jgi:uncharacterized protein (TIGR03435 family)
MTQRFFLVCCFLFALTAAVAAQRTERPEFNAASIKENNSGERGYSLPPPIGGRLVTGNTSFKMLILYAYHLQDDQQVGAKGWMNSDRFDIDAKGDSAATEARIRLMLQVLLETRFKLKLHRENKDLSMFSLRVAKRGLQMLRSVKDCPATPDSQALPCGGFRLYQRRMLTGRNVPMDELVDMLSTLTGRMVIDKTNLAGNFDIKLEWTPDEGLALGTEPGAQPPSNAAQGSLFTALEEQLGLRLQSEKGPVSVLVIDSAEKPSPN